MRAVVCQEFGPLDSLVVEDRPDVDPGEGMVRIDVAAAGVNFVDGLICQGKYQLKPPVPFVPGSEVAGTVSAVGPGVADWSVGDRVLVFCGFGGFATQVVAPALPVVTVASASTRSTSGSAAALIQSYCTMLFTLGRRTTVAPGEWVLVLGAGGGIGLAAVDVATALGARVIAAASTADKLGAAVAMGAEATIAYEEEDLKTRARELLRATRHLGRYCVIGFAAGPIPSIPANQVLLNNRTVVGVDWGGWTFKDPLGNRALIDELLAMVAEGRLHPTAPSTRPLTEAAAVMTGLIDRTVTGKVVLTP